MYPAILKRQLLKPSVVRINSLTLASVHSKTRPDTTGNEECRHPKILKLHN